MPKPKAQCVYQQLKIKAHTAADSFRHQLSYIDALPQLTLLGLIAGITAALIIVLFRLTFEYGLRTFMGDSIESFESLDTLWHFLLPLTGAIIIGLGMQWLAKEHHQTGVSHVLDRLHNHQGQLPIVNLLVQFFGGALSLIMGLSVGREGPAVHLGAGAASQLGQWLKLPNNSLRTLVGCGVAAAIAASFNTPMAGVIFAMEAVLMEYTITGFIPVILASVSGAVIAQIFFDKGVAFDIVSVQLNSLWELPYIAFSGVIVGLLAAIFIRLHLSTFRLKKKPILFRLTLAGLITGTVALFIPQIMGLGYDTVEASMLGKLSFGVLVTVALAKLCVTSVSAGLGMPGGIISPMFVIGACAGGALGIGSEFFYQDTATNTALYVLLGMSAMMAATLNAPLAALMAVLELTYNPNMIFPTMLIIVVACLSTRQLFHCEGIFLSQLSLNGTPVQPQPMHQTLSRAGVRSVMDTRFVCTIRDISTTAAKNLLITNPMWILISEAENGKYLLRAADLANYLESHKEELDPAGDTIDLLEIPGQRFHASPINQQANLVEAQQLFQQEAEALYVTRPDPNEGTHTTGIVTQEMIDNYYQV